MAQNPILNEKVFNEGQDRPGWGSPYSQGPLTQAGQGFGGTNNYDPSIAHDHMSVEGTITKTILLMLVAIATGAITWQMVTSNSTAAVAGKIDQTGFMLTMLGAFGTIALVVLLRFKPRLSPALAIPIAVGEGLSLGGISAMFNNMYNGIAVQAAMATGAIFFTMLGLYRFRIIRVTERLRSIIIGATMAVAVFYGITFLLSIFNVRMPLVWDSGGLGILFSLVIICLAASNLLLNFDFIERASNAGVEKYMEWTGAVGILVTVAWLYREVLMFLAKMNRR